MTDGGGTPRGPNGGGGVENCIICANGVKVGGAVGGCCKERVGGATFMEMREGGKGAELGGRGRRPILLFPVENPKAAEETDTFVHCVKFDECCKDCKNDRWSVDSETDTVDAGGSGCFPESSVEIFDGVFCVQEALACVGSATICAAVELLVIPPRWRWSMCA